MRDEASKLSLSIIEKAARANQFEAYRRRVKLRRTLSIGTGFLTLGLISSLRFIVQDLEVPVAIPVFLAISITILLPLIIMETYFHTRPLRPPHVPDGTVVKPLKINYPGQEVYYEEIPIKIRKYAIIPQLIILAILLIFFIQLGPLLWSLAMLMVFGIILVLIQFVFFRGLMVSIKDDAIMVKFGPLKKMIPIADIESIRSATMDLDWDTGGISARYGGGFGWSTSDGTKVYWSSSEVGVRITMKDGHGYLISASDPQAVVNYIRSIRMGLREMPVRIDGSDE
jgi:hypothetical protein